MFSCLSSFCHFILIILPISTIEFNGGQDGVAYRCLTRSISRPLNLFSGGGGGVSSI
jgi:hypothetical protein